MLKLMLLTVTITGFASTAWAAGDAVAGKAAAASCVMCHGANGEGNQMGPKVAGMDQGKFIQAMNDYKSGKRDNAMMKNAANQSSPTDTANMAAYYATLK